MKGYVAVLLLCLLSTGVLGDGEALYKEGAELFTSDPVKACRLFVEAAGEGNVPAMVGAAHCLENGVGTKQDYAASLAWYEKAVAQNNLAACEGLARIYASCPDPQFHDGELAIKYAEALVRKKPKDPDAFALLAAAYARGIDFGQAVRFAGKALGFERRAPESAILRRQAEGYRQGAPYPQVATEDWMIAALNLGSQWAIDRMLWHIADRFDPLYDPAKAMRICEDGIKAGNKQLYSVLGYLFLYAGNLDEARDSFKDFHEDWVDHREDRVMSTPISCSRFLGDDPDKIIQEATRRQKEWERVVVSGTGRYADGRTYSIYREFESREEAEMTFPSNPNAGYEVTINSTRYPPDMAAVEFLLLVAAAKGSPAAKEQLEALESRMRISRKLLEGPEGMEPAGWAAALSKEALKYCNNDVLPVNLPLAAVYLEASYAAAPSARTACILGRMYLRDYMYRQDYQDRLVDEAIHWLEIAHAQGYGPATRRLIELYACDADENICNGELALRYATSYAATSPKNDFEALRLLACAYARNKQFRNAEETMQTALGNYPETRGPLYHQYMRELKSFEQGSPCTVSYHAYPQNQTSKLFADWVDELD